MFSSLYNFLNGHLRLARKRRASDASNSGSDVPPTKIVKYQTAPDGPFCTLENMAHAEKENKMDDEVVVVEELKHVDRTAPRKLITREGGFSASSTPVPSSSGLQWRTVRVSPMSSRSIQVNDTPDIQVLSTIRHIPIQRTGKLAKKTVSEKIFGPFKPPATRFTQAMKRKQADQYTKYKTYLEEKMAYRRLLDMYQSNTLDTSTYTVAEIKPRSPMPKKEPLVINLEQELKSLRVNRDNAPTPSLPSLRAQRRKDTSNYVEIIEESGVTSPRPTLKPVNSLKSYLDLVAIVRNVNYVKEITTDHATNTAEKRRQARLEEAKLAVLTAHNEKTSADALEKRVREYMKITEPPVLEIEEVPEYFLPSLTEEQEERVRQALKPSPPGEVLAEKFKMPITRKDIGTLKGLNWLNDEIINFYMELIMARGSGKPLPKVYAFSTFFYENIKKGRFSTVRRWTKKVDLFTYDMVLVPVHMGMHWCMSVIDFRSKEVRYYDSMGADNDHCLGSLLSYLEQESMDKKKQTFDTTDWKKINVEKIPQQMNGSDCGVFACVFAEHLARNAPLLFSQENMPYFRRKMVTEILEGALIT